MNKEYKLMADYKTLLLMINEIQNKPLKAFLSDMHDAIYDHIGKNNFEAEKLITELKSYLNNEGIK